eukprot:6176958-Pleurochrysis_carterae.AAC.2
MGASDQQSGRSVGSAGASGCAWAPVYVCACACGRARAHARTRVRMCARRLCWCARRSAEAGAPSQRGCESSVGRGVWLRRRLRRRRVGVGAALGAALAQPAHTVECRRRDLANAVQLDG